MASSGYHKRQAEALIAELNARESLRTLNKDSRAELIALAQIHATLATVEDVDDGKLGYL